MRTIRVPEGSLMAKSDDYAELFETYVISLLSENERWEQTQRECEKVGITPQRFAAMGPEDGRKHFPNSPLMGGTLGLAASNDRMLELAASSNFPWVLFLEDDVRFTRHARPITKALATLQLLPDSVGLVRVGFMTGNELWWQDIPLRSRIRIFLRPRSRFRKLQASRREKSQLDKEFPPRPEAANGSLGLLVRPSLAREVQRLLDLENVVIDISISDLLLRDSPLFRQSRKPWVTQRRVSSVRLRLDRETMFG